MLEYYFVWVLRAVFIMATSCANIVIVMVGICSFSVSVHPE